LNIVDFEEIKHQEAISKFAAALLSRILPCTGFHNKRLMPQIIFSNCW
jgi:hypothetical protein